MARVHGFELKDMVEWVGEEGYAFQGELWLIGVRLGLATEDANGGPMRYEFPTAGLDDLIAEQCDDLREPGYSFAPNLDILCGALADATKHEEWLLEGWADAQARGRVLVVCSTQNSELTLTAPALLSDESIEKAALGAVGDREVDPDTVRVVRQVPEVVQGEPLAAADWLERHAAWQQEREQFLTGLRDLL